MLTKSSLRQANRYVVPLKRVYVLVSCKQQPDPHAQEMMGGIYTSPERARYYVENWVRYCYDTDDPRFREVKATIKPVDGRHGGQTRDLRFGCTGRRWIVKCESEEYVCVEMYVRG